jgi:DNA modification methylase
VESVSGMNSCALTIAHALQFARALPAESIDCIVTSPPYWGHRRYGVAGEIGQEPTPEEYIDRLTEVFGACRLALRDSGVMWVNIGDTYYQGNKGGSGELRPTYKQSTNKGSLATRRGDGLGQNRIVKLEGLKPKDLIGIPAMLAFSCRADGWYWRGDCVWGKPNGMPESVIDRPTRAHEYVHLFTKSHFTHYDGEAVRTAPKASTVTRLKQDVENQQGSARANGGAKTNGPMKAVARKSDKQRGHSRRHDGFNDRWDAMEKSEQMEDGANLRSIWWIAPAQTREEHYAVMPERVAEICIRSGCPEGGTVYDPFTGFGTTAVVALRLGRKFIGSELNSEYAEMARKRIIADAPLLNQVEVS